MCTCKFLGVGDTESSISFWAAHKFPINFALCTGCLIHPGCRGIGTRVGSPKRKQPFKTRMDRLGCSWAELGRRMAGFSKAISRTECQQSAQAQPAHPLHRQDDHPIGPQLGRDGCRHGRLPRAIDPAEGHQSAQAQSVHLTPPGEVDPEASRRSKYEVINALSRNIGMAEKSSHIKDLAEISCRLLRRFRGLDDKTLTPSSIVHRHALQVYSMGRRLSGPV